MLHQPVIPSVSRRRLLGAALASCCGAARAQLATAAATAPLRLLVGAAPGSAMDIIEKSPLSKLIVTDSIPLSEEKKRSPKIVSLTISELMGKAIRNIHEEASVTSLFV